MFPFEPPLLPDADEAREWAERELAKDVYHQGEPWLRSVLDAIARFFTDLADAASGLGTAFIPILLVVLVAAIVAAALILGGPVARRRARAVATLLEDDDERTSAELRRAARAAADAGDNTLAVIEMFRALIRGLDERAIGSDTGGRTAQEAARAAGEHLPALAPDLRDAAAGFDAVRYGGRRARSADLQRLVDLDGRAGRARPDHAGEHGRPAGVPS